MPEKYIFGQEKYSKAVDFLDDTNLPFELKAHLAKLHMPKLSNTRKELDKEIKSLNKKLHEQETILVKSQAKLAILEEVSAWEKSCYPYKLEKNDCSRLHKLVEAVKDGKWLCAFDLEGHQVTRKTDNFKRAKSFVVQNDWYSLFKDAEEFSNGDFKLPYEICAFEFKVSGRIIILIVSQEEDGPMHYLDFIQCGKHWVSSDGVQYVDGSMFGNQIRAMCIALEAEVASKEVIRADVALNRARKEKGELPVFDYHVISLAKRHRVEGPATGNHRSPRLHFRRGHWRHFENHKTWIKWMLVGNPDLGFIGKEYRL